MNQISPEQNEVLREKDSQIGLSPAEEEAEAIKEFERNLSAPEQPNYVRAVNGYKTDMEEWRQAYDKFVDCHGTSYYPKGECPKYPHQPVFSDYYEMDD